MMSCLPFSPVSTQQQEDIFKTQTKSYHSPAQNPTHFFLWPDKLSPLLCSPYSTHVGLSIAAQIRHQSHVLTIHLPGTFPVIAPSSNLGLCLKCHLPNVLSVSLPLYPWLFHALFSVLTLTAITLQQLVICLLIFCLVDVNSLRTETLLLNFSFPDPRIFWHIASVQYLLNEWI